MHTPGRGEGALRRHRASLPQARYFVTLCYRGRTRALTDPAIARSIFIELDGIAKSGHWHERAAVLMPDHLHLFVRLGDELPLARCIARLKSRTRGSLAAAGLTWQSNYYEHRLRPTDVDADVLRYLFLNPYRAGLLPLEETYPWWRISAFDSECFSNLVGPAPPEPAWLR